MTNETRILITSFIVPLIPLLAAIFNYKYISGYLIPLFIYVACTYIVECLAFPMKRPQSDLIYLVYAVLEFSLLSLFYREFFKPYVKGTVFHFLIIVFIVTVTLFYLKSMDPQKANSSAITIESFIMTCLSLYLFYFILKNLVFEKITDSPVFWINLGILFYFAGNFIIFAFTNYFVSHIREQQYGMLWIIIHTTNNILMNIFFAIGFWKARVR